MARSSRSSHRFLSSLRVGLLALAALALAFLTPALVPAASAPARAADTPSIRRMDVTAVAEREQGTMHVTQDFDMEFFGSGNHGPYVTLVTRQAVAGDPDHWRVLRYGNIRATSPTGAPAQVETEQDSGLLKIRVGDPDRTVRGTQRYVLTYDVAGVVNPDATGGNGDEIYWNVIGTGWESPMDRVSVTLQGPVAVTGTACYAGSRGGSGSCGGSTSSGERAVFTQDHLAPGDGLTVVAQWPIGTFVDAAPLYAKRFTAANTMTLAPGPLGVGAGTLLLGGLVAALTFRRRGRDQAYVGLTPGLRPAPGQESSVGPRRPEPVTVRFTPPDDASPGQIGTLIDGRAGRNDVVAGIVDLAVRGQLRIEEIPPEVDEDAGALAKAFAQSKDKFTDWRLVRLRADAVDLPPHLATLQDELFAKQDAPELRHDLGTRIAAIMQKEQSALNREMTGRGWYRVRPDLQRAGWMLVGLLLLLAGIALGIALGATIGWGWVGAGPAVLGIGVFVLGFSVSARTADGSAVLAQAEGFKEYLMTAEADQIRVEEDHDIFSRYLPWAIAFGAESHWVGVFREMVAAGRPVAEPLWYHTWTGASVFAADNAFFGAPGSFMDAASSAGAWSASAGAGGMSGMSGGSVGGGVGGGGGGGW
ncbi:DUF2207 domain-containing protein [Raineyella sp. LH-20]|uniref:DUF2207 domain-containing protein n=1 Tax=Raineyella sp. LH-20 TaxID=3081204 RepID=UPI0029550BA5|nr:DUF2207 domain-containing protein [Raineyella sp. LH-20]WOP19375.1 DUF2207 domain-containing protein [Raineyella sp. LH-20]